MADSASIMELHTALVDAKGYDQAIQDTEKPQLKALFEKAKSLHEKAHAEIWRILRARAANPEYEASFLAPVHKVAVSTGAAVLGLSESFPSSFLAGETIVEAFNKAINANGDDGPACGILEQQKSVLLEFAGELQREAR